MFKHESSQKNISGNTAYNFDNFILEFYKVLVHFAFTSSKAELDA